MGVERVGIPKGTRDFGPLEMVRREYIFGTVREIFARYGYQPLETPAMENLSTLLGKYGAEGDKLLFRILNSGDFLRGLPEDAHGMAADRLAPYLCDRGLRYDLTVPFARFVSQHWHELPKPFKRFQIQPVWRADRPQKGRYREFYQCDIDVVGSESPLCELELVQVVQDVFQRLGLRVALHFNHRKVLAALAEATGRPELLIPITVAIDKYDKIGRDGVRQELQSVGLTDAQLEQLLSLVEVQGDNADRLEALESALGNSPSGRAGIEEIRKLLDLARHAGVDLPMELDLSLARGLNYYTGAIFEVKAQDCQIGSVCGGGRYDDLTGIFGLEGVSGVGISFGADRIYDAMLELSLFPPDLGRSIDLLVLNLGPAEVAAGMRIAGDLRRQGHRAMIYPDEAKFKRQMEYANRLGAPWVLIVGSDELQRGEAAIKNMNSGAQHSIRLDECAAWIHTELGKV